MMDEFGLTCIDHVAAEITRRSKAALRTALRGVRDGRYEARMTSDGFEGETVEPAVAVTIGDDHVTVDYAGSSPRSSHGANVVLNYTRAYTSFAVKAALAPAEQLLDIAYTGDPDALVRPPEAYVVRAHTR